MPMSGPALTVPCFKEWPSCYIGQVFPGTKDQGGGKPKNLE